MLQNAHMLYQQHPLLVILVPERIFDDEVGRTVTLELHV